MPNREDDLILEALPYNKDAEQAVLGGMLIDPDSIPVVLEKISTPEMFYLKQHAQIFDVLLDMSNQNKTIDFLTTLNEVNKSGVFKDSNDAKTYLAQLMETVPSTANISDYCSIICDQYYRRRLITTAKELENYAQDQEGDTEQLLTLAEQRINDIRQNRDSSGLRPIFDLMAETYDHLSQLNGEDREKYLGIESGFTALDLKLSRLNRSDLILLAARPAMGKSAFALNIAVNVAMKYPDKSVAVFNLEMSAEQLVNRIISSEAQIPSYSLRTGQLGDRWQDLAACMDRLSRTHIYIDDTAGINAAEMKAKAKRLPNLALVVIDYLQLMESGSNIENRVQEVSKITRSLKIMAKELDVPVLVLSQLNRSVESRTDHKPMLSDLRESGSIEQDADSVLFLSREGYYNKDCETPYLAVCTVAKNRHGETGDINLRWDGEFTRFSNLETEMEPPPF